MKKLIFATALLCFFRLAVEGFDRGQQALTTNHIEDIVRQTAVNCYATKGFYPPDVKYMVENCGLQVNTEKYTIHYSIFATNLMPDITVVEVGS